LNGLGRRRAGLCSVVIAARNEGGLLRATVASVLEDTAYPDVEVVVVDDGSTDGGPEALPADPRVRVLRLGGAGLSKARNAGAALALGEYLVFLDAHCTVSPDWLHPLLEALRPADVAVAGPCVTPLEAPGPRACGMTWVNRRLETAWFEPPDGDLPYEVPFVPGGCQAYRARTFELVGRFDEGMRLWGYEDIEICLRAWLLGYRAAGAPAATVAHLFKEKRDFEVPDYGVLLNFLRLVHLHFAPWRVEAAIRAIGDYPALDRALREVATEELRERRAELEAVRVHDDDWFFGVFMPRLWGPRMLVGAR
jgi:GT2 family glycosyltransferase